mmetsp:Transcript_28798/g.47495  ORF Transcript_28798/g.47495 Transcript_28798/m.47495 type:complete len:263 (-) Transcript_28798:2-790(-)
MLAGRLAGRPCCLRGRRRRGFAAPSGSGPERHILAQYVVIEVHQAVGDQTVRALRRMFVAHPTHHLLHFGMPLALAHAVADPFTLCLLSSGDHQPGPRAWQVALQLAGLGSLGLGHLGHLGHLRHRGHLRSLGHLGHLRHLGHRRHRGHLSLGRGACCAGQLQIAAQEVIAQVQQAVSQQSVWRLFWMCVFHLPQHLTDFLPTALFHPVVHPGTLGLFHLFRGHHHSAGRTWQHTLPRDAFHTFFLYCPRLRAPSHHFRPAL